MRPSSTSLPAPGGAKLQRIVSVSGGAGAGVGGLELATRLGDMLGQKGRAHITLMEKVRSHFWKPHLHEIAAGSMNLHARPTDELAQSHWHGFRHRAGEMIGLDRAQRVVQVGPVVDEDGVIVTPPTPPATPPPKPAATTHWSWLWTARPATSARRAWLNMPSRWKRLLTRSAFTADWSTLACAPTCRLSNAVAAHAGAVV